MQCLTIAIENPPKNGEYRVFNQFEEVYNLTELALKVQKVAGALGLKVEVRNLENPRIEPEEHYYNPDHKHLLDLGYQPTHDIEAEMEIMLEDLMKFKHRIEARAHALIPDIRWDGSRRKVGFLQKEGQKR
jgi:UDP-sulfoquinovose synthase